MKMIFLLVACLCASVQAAPEPAAAPVLATPSVDEALALVPDLQAQTFVSPRDRLIATAIRETLAESGTQSADGIGIGRDSSIIRSGKSAILNAAFDEARVPDCLHPDGLRMQPTNIGPIAFVGLYAAPFVLIAKLRGKCS